MWSAIMNFLGGPFTGWVEGRQARKYMKEEGRLEIKKAEVALRVAEFTSKADRLAKSDLADSEYDLAAQREKRYTIADEVLMLCTIVMVVCTFLFPAPMALGYAALQAAPWWVEFMVVGVYISVFGLMRLFRAWSPFNKSKENK
tara:strand:- start:1610 stop:2041 length:432 start_codon:yes stop_codon:yes gene_type:complete